MRSQGMLRLVVAGVVLVACVALSGCQTARTTRWQTEVGVSYKTPEGLEVTISCSTDRPVATAPNKPADPPVKKLKVDLKYTEPSTKPAKK